MIIRLKTPEGKIALRKAYLEQFGNFVMAKVRYKNEWYLLKEWDGDEYLRGADIEKEYTLGRMIQRGYDLQ